MDEKKKSESTWEVEHTPWAVAPDKQSVESLVLTLEDVREAVRRMALAFSVSSTPRPRWPLALMGVAAMCALVFAVARPATVSPAPENPAPVTVEVLTMDEEPDLATSGWLVDTTDGGTSAPTRPLPRGPFKGQKRPPCKRPAEVELVGGCWAEHALKAPCPDELYEYQGKCYIPAFSAKPPPQALEQQGDP